MKYNQNYEKIKKELAQTRELFEDNAFSPEDNILCHQVNGMNIVWMRPHQISRSRRPLFIQDGLSRFDLDQGRVGNCWFIAGAATLACKQHLFRRCVPMEQSFQNDYYGIFKFNFWHYGDWVEIVVDDRLPCENGNLIFCHNREEPDEFWSALFEKAYAKLYGGYGRLDGGQLGNALVDFTGGITESLDIRDKDKIPDDIFETLFNCSKMNSFMGCSIDGNYAKEQKMPNGLYKGHAYSITAVELIKTNRGKVQMVRVMNPWGKGEWRGDWSDSSNLWNNVDNLEKRRIDYRHSEDGEFWMNYTDWMANFQRLEIVHLEPDAYTDKLLVSRKTTKWETHTFHGEWVKGISAGGCGNSEHKELFQINPQFSVNITQSNPSKMIISLIQKIDDFQVDNAAAFQVFRMRKTNVQKANNNRYQISDLKRHCEPPTFKNAREISQRVQVDKSGIYVIIPCTFDPHISGKFLLRVFTENPTEYSSGGAGSNNNNQAYGNAIGFSGGGGGNASSVDESTTESSSYSQQPHASYNQQLNNPPYNPYAQQQQQGYPNYPQNPYPQNVPQYNYQQNMPQQYPGGNYYNQQQMPYPATTPPNFRPPNPNVQQQQQPKQYGWKM